MKSPKQLWQKWSIAVKVMPLLVLIAALKLLSHKLGFEVMELNALFTSLIAGTIFLIGFLISGVLSDYKESEKIPSELTAALKALSDDAYTIWKSKNSETARNFIDFEKVFIHSLLDWFYKKERTKTIFEKLSQMNDFFVELDKEGVIPAYIVKMKNEQSAIRKLILRVDTIRDTNFIGSAYAIVEAMGVLTGIGLIMIKIEPFYASLFITLLVIFLISYMVFLIIDLDNPFDYSAKGESGTEVSLKPLYDLQLVMNEFR
jgi:hypothetical protein